MVNNKNLGFKNSFIRNTIVKVSFKLNAVGVFVNRKQKAQDLTVPF